MFDLLFTPFMVALLCAFLALIITITDKIVNNYGDIDININDQKTVTVKGGSTLLHSLAEKKIFVPSACGGKGSCGACRLKVNTDIGPIFATEIPHFTTEEINNNYRLACQVKVKQAMSISIPEELFNIQEIYAPVTKITNLTHDIKEVQFTLPEGTDLSFKAGQYAQLEVPPYGKKVKESVQRAYSISSSPYEKGVLEFMIRLVPEGSATTYVHNYLKEGDTMRLIVPCGDFHLHDTDAAMICVAGGSGMAPIKSLIFQLAHDNLTRPVWYFFGARGKKDLFCLDEFKELEKKHPNIHFIPALSDPAPEDNWTGDTGMITDVLDHYLKNEIGDGPKEGYLCGSPGMLNACINIMTQNNMTEDKIYYDKFS